jgi:hypothetical protein
MPKRRYSVTIRTLNTPLNSSVATHTETAYQSNRVSLVGEEVVASATMIAGYRSLITASLGCCGGATTMIKYAIRSACLAFAQIVCSGGTVRNASVPGSYSRGG